MDIGSAHPSGEPRSMLVKGRDMVFGLPKTIKLEDDAIRGALAECVNAIVNAIRVALERTPPELSGDISDRGIILTGGGSLLRNLDQRIRFETGMPVLVAHEPLASVVMGTGKMLEDFKLLRKISLN
jgi:rod shape-determining protein MreB